MIYTLSQGEDIMLNRNCIKKYKTLVTLAVIGAVLSLTGGCAVYDCHHHHGPRPGHRYAPPQGHQYAPKPGCHRWPLPQGHHPKRHHGEPISAVESGIIKTRDRTA